MYGASPKAMRSFTMKWQKRKQAMLRHRIKTVEASIDNKPPRQFSHLVTKRKRDQLLLGTWFGIEMQMDSR